MVGPALAPGTIPFLIKAVDFLFEEGKKILQEIRARRKESTDVDKTTKQTDSPRTPIIRDEQGTNDVIISKEDALNQKISEKDWADSEKEIEHLLRLLKLDTRSYRLAQEQYKMYGRALVPPIVLNRLMDAEKGIEDTTKKLQKVMSKIYNKKIYLTNDDE